MGIRTRCPQGHTLNLKPFLAGRRGICPVCGIAFTIPTVGDASPSPPLPGGPDATLEADPVPRADIAPPFPVVSSSASLQGGRHHRTRSRVVGVVVMLGLVSVLLLTTFLFIIMR